MSAIALTPEQKILAVEVQIHDMLYNGAPNEILCPWCNLVSTPGQYALCCDNLAIVVEAILDYKETKDQIERIARIMERLSAGVN
jgi:hypothetical protein